MLTGDVLSGAYEKVLRELKGAGFRPSAVVALFAANAGVEDFIASCRRALPGVPMVGGVSARGEGRKAGELLPGAGDAALLLVSGGACEVDAINVHDPAGVKVDVEKDGERRIARVRARPGGAWVSAMEYYASRRESRGVPADDYESVAFSDLAGVNVHCSPAGGGLKTGANLPEEGAMELRVTDADRVTNRLREWAAAENALVFCCAGLRKLVRPPVGTGEGTLAGFMHGEVVTVGGAPAFGNLMMGRIRMR
jgi:hypothetical protein